MKRLVVGVGVAGVLAAVVAGSRLAPSAAEPGRDDPGAIRVAVEDKNPWTGLKVNNDPAAFRFAVVSDRTGGHRPKVFDRAVRQINLLQPEFVLSVGDLIEGYTAKKDVLDKEWKEFGGMVAKFEMPFFYVPGNHDLTNKEQAADWKARFGRTFYHFVYRDVLFLAVNSEDGATSRVTADQADYFRKALDDNRGVRWTLVFTHKPLWAAADPEKNGWAAVEKALAGRNYTVFCGHVHRFQKFVRNGMSHYQLATTGGGSRMRGVEYGEFDQIAWVTMKKDGPLIAHVALDGVYPEDLKPFDSDEPGVPERANAPKPVPATGTVQYDGKPLAGATVTFHRKPAADALIQQYQAVADALTDKDGRFTPTTAKPFDGVPEGEYKVTVFLSATGKYHDGEVKAKSGIDERFAAAGTTPLAAVVKAGEVIKLVLEK